MNIKITKEEFQYMIGNIGDERVDYVIGSKLYGTATDKSDTDILILHNFGFGSDIFYPNHHQLQYDDEENNTQYILTTLRQFNANLFSGDSTINVDIVMFKSVEFPFLF